MSDVWVQVIAGLSGIASTVAVKYLEHLLTRRRRDDDPSPPPPAAIARTDEA